MHLCSPGLLRGCIMKREKENYLDFVPVINPRNQWKESNSTITIDIVHKGFYSSVAQRFFHTPRVSHIDLDKYGSFVWRQIDGSRNVGDIADRVKQRFGKDAEPLYGRLIKFIQILNNNKFVLYEGRDKL